MKSNIEQMQTISKDATHLLKALAHRSRLLICCQLNEGEMSIGEMEASLHIKQPGLSRELAKLREEGILKSRRESKVIFYRLESEKVSVLIDAMCSIYLSADMKKIRPSQAP